MSILLRENAGTYNGEQILSNFGYYSKYYKSCEILNKIAADVTRIILAIKQMKLAGELQKYDVRFYIHNADSVYATLTCTSTKHLQEFWDRLDCVKQTINITDVNQLVNKLTKE